MPTKKEMVKIVVPVIKPVEGHKKQVHSKKAVKK